VKKQVKKLVDAELIAHTDTAVAVSVHRAAFAPVDGRHMNVVVQVRSGLLMNTGVAAELRALADAVEAAS
jgi:hypothetical protein